MQEVGTEMTVQRANFFNRTKRPERARRGAGGRHAGKLCIVAAIQHHVVAVPAQHRDLGVDQRVFAAAVVIGIVGDEDFHRLPMLGSCGKPGMSRRNFRYDQREQMTRRR